VTDEQRGGRPSTSAYLVAATEDTVRANCPVLLKELEEQFNLSHGTIWDIVHERLGYSILARWRNYFSQLLNVYGVNDVRQTEIHTAVPFVAEQSSSEVELAIEKLKSHKSPGIDQIPAEMIKSGR